MLPFDSYNINDTYKRIQELNYYFPNNVIISQPAKDLIKRILVKDPKERPTLDEILQSYFFKMGKTIPKTLSENTSIEPPSLDFIKQYMPDVNHHGIVTNYIKNQKPFFLPTNNGTSSVY